jgi:Rrf2 family protein
MFRLSTKGRYGTRLMLSLALREDGEPVSLREIASDEDISENYLWQVAKPLRDAGLIVSVAGAGGGYNLALSADRITLLDVLTALEGEIALVDCQDAADRCARGDFCVTRVVWHDLSTLISKALEEMTLADLAARQRTMAEQAALNYVI